MEIQIWREDCAQSKQQAKPPQQWQQQQQQQQLAGARARAARLLPPPPRWRILVACCGNPWRFRHRGSVAHLRESTSHFKIIVPQGERVE